MCSYRNLLPKAKERTYVRWSWATESSALYAERPGGTNSGPMSIGGGSTEAIRLDPAYERTAVRAAQIMGLKVAGVDLLEGDEGPLVMEVNSSPGLEGIETATGLDIAGSIIDYIANPGGFSRTGRQAEVNHQQRDTVWPSFL